MIRSLISSAVSRSLIRTSNSASQYTYLTALDNVSKAYIELANPINVGEFFEIEVVAALDTMSGNREIFGSGISDAGQGVFGIRVDSADNGAKPRMILPRQEISENSRYTPHDHVVINPYEMNTYVLKVIKQNEQHFIVNGVDTIRTFNDIDVSKQVANVGAFLSNSSSMWDGEVASVKIWTGGDRVSGNLVLDLDLSKKYDSNNNVVASKTDADNYMALGGYLNDSTAGSDISFENGFLSVDKPYEEGEVGWNFNDVVEESKTYILYLTGVLREGEASFNLGRWTQDWQSAGSNSIPTGDSAHLVKNTGRLRLRLLSGKSGKASVQNVKLLEVTNAGEIKNAFDSISKPFELIDGEHYGPNLMTQELWEVPSQANSAWSYDADKNTWSLDGDGSLQFLQPILGSEQSNVMHVKGKVLSINGLMTVSASTTLEPISETGIYTAIIYKSIDGHMQFKRRDGTLDVEVTKPTVRRLIPSNYDASLARIYTRFSTVDKGYINLTEEILLNTTEGFELEATFEYVDTGESFSGARLLGKSNSDDGASLLKVFNPNASTTPYQMNFAMNGQFISIPDFFSADDVDKFHTIHIRAEDDWIEFYLNRELKRKDYRPNYSVIFDRVGAGQGDHSNGIVSDVKIWKEGTRHTGRLVLNMPIDQVYNSTQTHVEDLSYSKNHGQFIKATEGGSQYHYLPIVEPFDYSNGRYYLTFYSVAGSYVLFDKKTYLGDTDFSASIDFASTSDTRVLFGGDDDENSLVMDLYLGYLRVFVRVGWNILTVISFPISEHLDGSYHNAEVRYSVSTSTVELLFDGEVVESGTWELNGNQFINTIGGRPHRTIFFDGILANLKIYQDGHQNNGKLVVDCPLDQQYTYAKNTVINHSDQTNNGTIVNVSGDDSVYHYSPLTVD